MPNDTHAELPLGELGRLFQSGRLPKAQCRYCVPGASETDLISEEFGVHLPATSPVSNLVARETSSSENGTTLKPPLTPCLELSRNLRGFFMPFLCCLYVWLCAVWFLLLAIWTWRFSHPHHNQHKAKGMEEDTAQVELAKTDLPAVTRSTRPNTEPSIKAIK